MPPVRTIVPTLAPCSSRSRTDAPPRFRAIPSIPVTRGFLCAKVAKYLDRVYSPDRVLYPMRRVAAKGTHGDGAFQRITWDEALDEIANRFRQISAEFGPEAVLPYSYGGNIGAAERRVDGHALLPSPGRVATASQHLFASRRRRHHLDLRPQNRHRARAIPPLEVHHRVGREHSRQQRSSVAVHRRGAAQWREAGGHRSLSHAHGAACRLAHPDQSRYRRCARAGLDARHRARWPARSTTTSRATPRVSTNWRSGCPSTRRSASRSGPAFPSDDIERLAREYATTRPAVIRLNYGIQRSQNGGAAVRAVCMLPVITGSWKEVGGGSATVDQRRLSARPSGAWSGMT